MDTFDRIVLGIILLLIVLSGYIKYKHNKIVARCESQGGLYFKYTGCVKPTE